MSFGYQILGFGSFTSRGGPVSLENEGSINGQENREVVTTSDFIGTGGTLIIPSGFWVWSNTQGTAGLIVDTADCIIENYGKIIGRGGNGYNAGGSRNGSEAISITATGVTIINHSGAYIAGGGGTGGGAQNSGSGGGAGGGIGGVGGNGSGGTGGILNASGGNGGGSDGGASGGGAGGGGCAVSVFGNAGGGGGGRILPGSGGAGTSTGYGTGGSGGSAGNVGGSGSGNANGGGGGWGANGGAAAQTQIGVGLGGKGIESNSNSFTLTNNGTIYGASS